jgi:hypothetical protein
MKTYNAYVMLNKNVDLIDLNQPVEGFVSPLMTLLSFLYQVENTFDRIISMSVILSFLHVTSVVYVFSR